MSFFENRIRSQMFFLIAIIALPACENGARGKKKSANVGITVFQTINAKHSDAKISSKRTSGNILVSPAPLPAFLSQTSLYLNIGNKEIDPVNAIYEPQFPLWSDGAEKIRWIYIPPDNKINTSNMDRWMFPIGTKIWKEFSFRINDTETMKRVETRLIQKVGINEWQYGSYLWSDDETEARLAPSSGIRNAFSIGNGIQHDIPSISSCIRCHKHGGDPVLGFQALQLATNLENSAFLNLEKLARHNLITHIPERKPEIFARTKVGKEALGYLHVNCGSCHNPTGTASNTELFLQHTIKDVNSETDEPTYLTAVNRPTLDYQIPDQPESFQIKPGDPTKSAVFFRMLHRANSEAMPPIGTKVVDASGAETIRQWILELGLSDDNKLER